MLEVGQVGGEKELNFHLNIRNSVDKPSNLKNQELALQACSIGL